MAELEEKIINNVKMRPVLWDKKEESYFNKTLKENNWGAVAIECDKPVEVVQAVWKQLREKYNREKKKKEQPSGSGAESYQEWVHYTAMEFIKDSIIPRRTISNEPEDVENIPVNKSSTDHCSPRNRYRPYFAVERTLEALENTASRLTSARVPDDLDTLRQLLAVVPPGPRTQFMQECIEKATCLRRNYI